MTDFSKKWLTIAGGIALSGALILLISNQLTSDSPEDPEALNTTTTSPDLVVTMPEINKTEGENTVIVPAISGNSTGSNNGSNNQETQDVESSPDPNITIPEAGTMNGDDKGTSQTIQPDVATKPTYSQSQLTDPTQTPDGGKVTVTEEGDIVPEEIPTPPEPTPETVIPSTSDTTSSSTTATPPAPTEEKTSDTAVYFPGFGWIESSGPNVGQQLPDMYENGNKVGNM